MIRENTQKAKSQLLTNSKKFFRGPTVLSLGIEEDFKEEEHVCLGAWFKWE